MRKFILAAAAACSALPVQGQVIHPTASISTSSGEVAGKVLDTGVQAWLGVPFAKPPLYDLRWAPPQSISWNGVWNADRKMPECMQVLRPHNINNYFGEEATSEDCLYLNIWAPPGAKADAKLPVVVFIYGGGGTIGSAGSDMYDGADMARKGVIFVTIAYRVGLLGWMAHPELSREQGGHSGNYAYLDQSMALRWIHENIAKFGGDPARVTISGQSAGAASVSAQMHSPLSKGLFSAALMSSTCSIGAGRTSSLADGEKIGLEVEKRLGVHSLAEMREVAADRIVQLQAESQVGYSNFSGIRAGAVIDGYFFTRAKEEMAQAHEMSDVPVIANFNSGESASRLQKAHTAAEYRQIATEMYGKDAPAFLKLYPVKSDADVVPMAARVAREDGIANASRNCGIAQSKYNRSPIYIDMFDRKHSYAPGVKIADQDPASVGAYHNGDVVYWFENLDVFNKLRKTRSWTDWDRTLADRMSDALIAFARTGSPATPAQSWPAWSAKQDVYVNFGDKVEVRKFDKAGMEWLAAHVPAGGKAFAGGGAGAPGTIAGQGPRD